MQVINTFNSLLLDDITLYCSNFIKLTSGKEKGDKATFAETILEDNAPLSVDTINSSDLKALFGGFYENHQIEEQKEESFKLSVIYHALNKLEGLVDSFLINIPLVLSNYKCTKI